MIRDVLYGIIKMARYIAVIILLLYWAAYLPSFMQLAGGSLYCILSGSMEPVIHTGSLVYTEPADDYHLGDIITYYLGETAVTHRIIGITGSSYVTKGDANDQPDIKPVTKRQIAGKVKQLPMDMYCIPWMGYIQMELREYRVKMMFLAAILITGNLLAKKYYIKRDKKGRCI